MSSIITSSNTLTSDSYGKNSFWMKCTFKSEIK